jgi:hypothetical protein
MKKTYRITLPKGARVGTIDAKVDNGTLNVTVGLRKGYIPIDGEIVVNGMDTIAIYAGTNKTGGIMTYAALHGQRLQTVVSEEGWGYTYDYHPATDAEKRRLFDALAKQGKRWNAEKKCIEDLPRWRAVCSGLYYIVDTDFFIREMKEKGERTDCALYNAGNYFRTREAAEKVASQIRDIFKNSKAE